MLRYDELKNTTLYCSFCGKSQYEVMQLIAGPTVFVCDECVEMCMEIVNEAKLRLVCQKQSKEERLHQWWIDYIMALNSKEKR